MDARLNDAASGLAIGALLAVGWGWNTLFHLSVAQLNSEAPAAATSVPQSGC